MRHLIDTALDSSWLWLMARLCLVIVFVSSGLAKLIDFDGSLEEMRQAGLEPDWFFALAAAVTMLGGSALIVLDRALWLGSGLLSGFLILTILIVHTFWNLPEPQAKLSLLYALEHSSLVGGLIAAAIASRLRARLRHAPDHPARRNSGVAS